MSKVSKSIEIAFDLEFLALRADATILSIGAVMYDWREGKILSEFNKRVDADHSMTRYGTTVSPSTIGWWMQQDKNVAAKSFNERDSIHIDVILPTLSNFYRDAGDKDVKIYSLGHLDFEIIEHAYTMTGMSIPWQHYDRHNARTLISEFPEIPWPDNKALHSALDDARQLADYLIKIKRHLAELKGEKLPEIEVPEPSKTSKPGKQGQGGMSVSNPIVAPKPNLADLDI